MAGALPERQRLEAVTFLNKNSPLDFKFFCIDAMLSQFEKL
jgi:hypothetical protein